MGLFSLTTIGKYFPFIDKLFQRNISTSPGGDVMTNYDIRPAYGLPLPQYAGDDLVIASALSSLYTQTITTRKQFVREMDAVKQFYLVQALLTAMIEDALTPDVTTGEILQVTSKNMMIQRELDVLQDTFSLDQIIEDIIVDMLSYGEYALRLIVEEGQGICDVVDDVDPTSLIAMYSQGYPYYYLQQTDRDIEVFPPYSFVHFVYDYKRLRVNIEKEFRYVSDYLDVFGQPFPMYARTGKSLLFGSFAKMKELMVLEQLIPAGQLNRILTGSLLTLQVPASMSPQEVHEACRRYENMINSKIGVDRSTGDISVTDILTTVGKVRILPQIGEKGQISNINDVKELRTLDDLLTTVQDVRAVICGSMGFPPEIFFGGRDSGGKADFLKRYSRYLRKLKFLQKSIARGVKQFCIIHLVNKDPSLQFYEDDISVEFSNELINVDELEKLEFSDGTVQLVSNIDRVVTELAQGASGQFIDINKYHQFLYKVMGTLGKENNFIIPPEGVPGESQPIIPLQYDQVQDNPDDDPEEEAEDEIQNIAQ